MCSEKIKSLRISHLISSILRSWILLRTFNVIGNMVPVQLEPTRMESITPYPLEPQSHESTPVRSHPSDCLEQADSGLILDSDTVTAYSQELEPVRSDCILPIASGPTSSGLAAELEAATVCVKKPESARMGADHSESLKPKSCKIATESCGATEYTILVLGATGSGKSSFVRTASGCEVEVSHDIFSCTY